MTVENLEVLAADPKYKQFKSIESYSYMEPFNDFNKETDRLIEKVNGLRGSLYSEEGKKAYLKEELLKLADTYMNKSDSEAKRINEEIAKLQREIAKDLGSNLEPSSEQAQIELLRNSNFDAEIKTHLLMLNDAHEVIATLNQLVRDVEYSGKKDLGKYLLKNTYKFLERAEKLGADNRTLTELRGFVKSSQERLKTISFSDRERALQTMSERIASRSISSIGSKRLIEGKLNSLIR